MRVFSPGIGSQGVLVYHHSHKILTQGPGKSYHGVGIGAGDGKNKPPS